MDVKKCLNSYPFILQYLNGVDENEIIENAEINRYKTGSKILTKGQKVEKLVIVFVGDVKISNTLSNGVNYTHKKLYAPIIIGDIEIVAQKDNSAANVVALSEVYALEIPIDVYLNWYNCTHKLVQSVAYHLAERFYDSSSTFGSDVVSSSKYNLASVFVKLVEDKVQNIDSIEDFEIRLTETRKQLSEMIATTERTVNRNIVSFMDEDCLSIRSRKVSINKKQYLNLKKQITKK